MLGGGEVRCQLEALAASLPVRFLGQVDAVEAQRQIAQARLLVLPSECFEGFPMVVREAFAFGTPAAVSDLGPLPSIVKHGESGVVFEAANSDSLLQTVRTAWQAPAMLQNLGQGARATFDANYTDEANYQTMMKIYQKAYQTSADWRIG
ncbi:MAG: glycosyltransferase family 4 protein [Comamonadaceae bacterium]|uniref:glycosyltransferase family 4 protein n=1 Tax=Candidatus Skiveiella danica TaxID=3386177 RepID=UPI003909C424|nr:glycosyltransferase family 4 protein [Comamonadaceae bacterium]